MRILIIDDELEVANTLALALEEEGHTPSVARNGAEGLVRLEDERPEAVFLDVRMPGLSGVDVLREIRRRDPGIPVVLLTGHATGADLAAARRLGVTDVVMKPWALKGLEEALTQLRPGPE
jgi:DNA-binding response OmpR family regulator